MHLLVVVLQLRVRVGCGSRCESNWHVCLADCGGEDVVTQRGTAIVGDGFVEHIPGVALAFVMCDFLGDVILQNLNQGGIVKAAIGHPRWQLIVPNESMAAYQLSILHGKVNQFVALGAAKGAKMVRLCLISRVCLL